MVMPRREARQGMSTCCQEAVYGTSTPQRWALQPPFSAVQRSQTAFHRAEVIVTVPGFAFPAAGTLIEPLTGSAR